MAEPNLNQYRGYLRALAQIELGQRLQGKVDPSDIVQQSLLEAHQDLAALKGKSEAELVAWTRAAVSSEWLSLIRVRACCRLLVACSPPIPPQVPAMCTSPRPRRGFTLVELLVVIAIIGVLVALLLPAVQAAREAARRTQCTNHLKQLGLAAHNFHDVSGTFPKQISPNGQTGVSWLCLVLPYLEQKAIADQVQPAQPSYQAGQNANRVLGRYKIPTFYCPSFIETHSSSAIDDITGFGNAYATHYVGNMGPVSTSSTGGGYAIISGGAQGALACDGIFPLSPTVVSVNPINPEGGRLSMVTDGTSNTLMTFEVAWKG